MFCSTCLLLTASISNLGILLTLDGDQHDEREAGKGIMRKQHGLPPCKMYEAIVNKRAAKAMSRIPPKVKKLIFKGT